MCEDTGQAGLEEFRGFKSGIQKKEKPFHFERVYSQNEKICNWGRQSGTIQIH